MKKDYCVYMHTSPNGKKYIGITCCKPRNRRWQNGYGYVNNKHFFSAIKKYGWQNIQHEILVDNLTADEAGRLEIEYINRYNTTDRRNGYNLKQGGQVGYHLSDEHKKKIGEANSGKRNGMYGHHYTKEEREYMSEHSVWNGRKHTEEARLKMSAAMKGNKNTKCGKFHHGARGINQYDINESFIAFYCTAVEAQEKTGVARSSICNCAKNKYKTAGGYIWRYADGN